MIWNCIFRNPSATNAQKNFVPIADQSAKNFLRQVLRHQISRGRKGKDHGRNCSAKNSSMQTWKKIENLMHKRHVKRTKYICVDLSFWRFQTSKHYFCISFFIARSHCGLGLSACLDFLHRAAIENASLAMMPCSHFLQSHEATLFFVSLCGTRFIRVHDTFMISSWYFIILVRIGSCWFMIGVVCMRYAMLLLRLSKIFSSVRGISELSWQLSAAASLFLWSSS